jgi:hypothetical protein
MMSDPRQSPIAGVVRGLALAAALTAGLTLTACSSASSPAQSGSAHPVGEDPGCQAILPQFSSLTSQLAADSDSFSAQVPVLQTLDSDLRAAAQKAQSSSVHSALQDMASDLQSVIIDEQNLMDGSTTDDSQLNSDFSSYKTDTGDLESACG